MAYARYMSDSAAAITTLVILLVLHVSEAGWVDLGFVTRTGNVGAAVLGVALFAACPPIGLAMNAFGWFCLGRGAMFFEMFLLRTSGWKFGLAQTHALTRFDRLAKGLGLRPSNWGASVSRAVELLREADLDHGLRHVQGIYTYLRSMALVFVVAPFVLLVFGALEEPCLAIATCFLLALVLFVFSVLTMHYHHVYVLRRFYLLGRLPLPPTECR